MTPFAEKSIASVSRKFHAQLRNLATLGFISDKSILGEMRTLIRDSIEDAYIEGLVEGGIPAEEVSAEDARAVLDLQSEQLAYVTDFVRAIRAAKDDRAAQRDILDNRVNLWTQTIETAGAQGLASAKANQMATWKLGKTEEHCKTCAWLNGQRHRLKWYVTHNYIPRQPGSETLECKGFMCDCGIYTDDGQRAM